MEDFVKQLDPTLDVIRSESDGESLTIYVASNRPDLYCPVCGQRSKRQHCTQDRTLQDVPFEGMKTRIVLRSRKMDCANPDCTCKCFSETFDFLQYKSRMTPRLINLIREKVRDVPPYKAAVILRKETADVGKSTLYNLLHRDEDLDLQLQLEESIFYRQNSDI